MAKLTRNLGTLLHVPLNETMAGSSGPQRGRLRGCQAQVGQGES